MDADGHRGDARCGAPIELAAARPRHDQSQPGRRLRHPRRRRRGRRRGLPPYAGGPHAEVVRAGRRPASGPAAAPLSSRWSPATTPAAPAPARQALIDAGVARVVVAVRRPEPGRGRRRGRRCGPPASRSRSACGATRPHAGNIGLADRRAAAGTPVRDLEVRRDAGRSLGRRRTAPASGSPRRRPGPTCTQLRAHVDAIMAGVGTVLADDPQLTVRTGATAPGRPAAAAGRGRLAGRTPADARVRDGAAPDLGRDRRRRRRRPGRPGRPARPAAALYERGVPRGAAGGRPDAGRRVPRRRPGRRGRRLRRARSCSAPARPRSPAPASPPSPRRSTLDSSTSARIGPDLRASPATRRKVRT